MPGGRCGRFRTSRRYGASTPPRARARVEGASPDKRDLLAPPADKYGPATPSDASSPPVAPS